MLEDLPEQFPVGSRSARNTRLLSITPSFSRDCGTTQFQPGSSTPSRKSGGDLIAIPSGLSWLQAAAELRSRSIGFDAVILHIHPNDLLPNLAFFDWAHPVLYFRHSDHLFNPGLDLARVIADIRPVGRAMSVHFCAKAPRKVMLPLPLLDEALTSCDKADARRKLGLPVDALVILTIGWPHKFIPIDGYNFSESFSRFVRQTLEFGLLP